MYSIYAKTVLFCGNILCWFPGFPFPIMLLVAGAYKKNNEIVFTIFYDTMETMTGTYTFDMCREDSAIHITTTFNPDSSITDGSGMPVTDVFLTNLRLACQSWGYTWMEYE